MKIELILKQVRKDNSEDEYYRTDFLNIFLHRWNDHKDSYIKKPRWSAHRIVSDVRCLRIGYYKILPILGGIGSTGYTSRETLEEAMKDAEKLYNIKRLPRPYSKVGDEIPVYENWSNDKLFETIKVNLGKEKAPAPASA